MADAQVIVRSQRVQKILAGMPGALQKAMLLAGHSVGRRYLGRHRAKRMRGPPGVRGTRRGLLTAFKYEVKGTSVNNMTLTMGSKQLSAITHERGKTWKRRFIPFSKFNPARKKLIRALARSRSLIPIKARDGRFFLAQAKYGGALGKRRVRSVEIVAQVADGVRNKPLLGFYQEWQIYRPEALKAYAGSLSAALKAARSRAGAVGT